MTIDVSGREVSILRRLAVWRALLPVLAGITLLAGLACSARADDDPKAKSAGLVQSATGSVQTFLTNSKWQAVRNLLGGARAIFIVPHDIQGGFLLTASGGDGVLLRRHGEVWSDPVFLHVSSVGVGFEAGGESQSLVMVIMTDAGVEQLLQGVASVGGSGSFALANLGVSGSASGNISSGLEVLTVATAQGLFAGGGLSGTQVSPQNAYNQAVYGEGYSMAAIAAGNGGKIAEAQRLREALTKAVTEAWGK